MPSSSLASMRAEFALAMVFLGGNCGLVGSALPDTSGGGLLSRDPAIDRLGGGTVGGALALYITETSSNEFEGDCIVGELSVTGFLGTGGAGLRLTDEDERIGTDLIDAGESDRRVAGPSA